MRIMLKVLLWILLIGVGSVYACESTICPQAGLSAEAIGEIEIVPLEALTINQDLIYDRSYRQVTQKVDIFDAPGGAVVRSLDAGFNFVTAIAEQDGWSQIAPNEWVQTEFLTEVTWSVSQFTGFFYPQRDIQYTIAWALVNMYPSPQPGDSPKESLGLIYRYTVLNIFAETEVDGERWYQIDAGKWVHQHLVSKVVPLATKPTDVDTELWIGIDLYEQNLVVYEGTNPIFATLISSGLPRWPTVEGVFHIYFRSPRKFMSWGTVGDDFYALEEVPWTMFFDEGRALHGAYWHDGFGYRRSHGCVNMSITDSHWLYNKVADLMGSKVSADVEIGPAVYVYSTGTYE